MSEGDVKQEPLMMYDITTDDVRPVTQADVDRWHAIEQAFGATRYILRRLLGCAPPPVPVTDWKEEMKLIGEIAVRIDDVKGPQ